jgi:ABC-type glycerol-3-phosphate transport system substrate-binding protein
VRKTCFSEIYDTCLPFKLSALLAVFLLASCGFWKPAVAVIRTDRPEFAIYAEYFNSSQDKYKIETRYSLSLTRHLTDTMDNPDIVVGSWLKSASTRGLFKPLDYLLKKDIDGDAFYSRLLSLGKIEDKQYLLPVSFNIPALAFSGNNSQLLSDLFVIEPEEIREIGGAYNRESGGAFTQMGFSPSWNDEFIFVIATLFNTGFREAEPLTWDRAALEESIQYIRGWISGTNINTTMENDFSFKYFFVPRTKLAISGRILFCYLESSEFFTLAREQRDNLDFRWIAGEDGTIPLAENTTYYGISKTARAKKAADAFTVWFFREDTQRLLLEESKRRGMNETLFGIGGGFSAMRVVTEHIFPRYYPGLLGHMPPEAALSPPNILPHNWMAIKRQVIMPYLHSRIRGENGGDAVSDLDRRLADWLRINRTP